MFVVSSWSKRSDKVFFRCCKYGFCFVSDHGLVEEFKRNCPDLIDKDRGFASFYYNADHDNYVFVLLPNVQSVPLPEPTSRSIEMRNMKFGFYDL